MGDPREVVEQLKAQIEALDLGAEERMCVNALMARNAILTDAKNQNIDSHDWQQRFVFVQLELANIIRNLRNGVNPVKYVPGLHIRAFRSRVDGCTQYYRVFVPDNIPTSAPLPLAIIPATTLSGKRPFLESAFIASHNDAVHVCCIAKQFGFAVLWPGYRGPPCGAPIELEHLDECLEAVHRNYNIDDSRVSLIGICSGGVFAGQAVARWPQRFDAVVYENGIFGFTQGRPVVGNTSFVKWLLDRDPLQRVVSNPGIDIFVINDGTKQVGHGEAALSYDFVQSATISQKMNVKSDFTQVFGVSNWCRIFEFLHSTETARSGLKGRKRLSAKGYVSGSIAEAFAGDFIVVRGTAGNAEESAAIDLFCRGFQDSWGEAFFGARCTILDDSQITADDLQSHSLVLVGTAKTNAVWGLCKNALPFSIEESAITSTGGKYEGRDLALQAVARSPFNPEKYVVAIGATDLQGLEFLPTDLATSAWYSNCVWRTRKNGPPRVELAQYFESAKP